MEGQRGLLPADSLIRVFLVQVCDEVVFVHCSQGRGLARWGNPFGDGHDTARPRQARPAPLPSRPHTHNLRLGCASFAGAASEW